MQNVRGTPFSVIPVETGIQASSIRFKNISWTPAFAGVTERFCISLLVIRE
jgi:hypothetical protein